jgi:hypothetical protein
MALICIKKDKKTGQETYIDTDDLTQEDYHEYCELEKQYNRAKTVKEKTEIYNQMDRVLRRVFNA